MKVIETCSFDEDMKKHSKETVTKKARKDKIQQRQKAW